MKITTTLTLSRLKRGLRTLILPVALCAGVAHAQTVLINPATDGGFEMGTGSLADNGWTTVNDGTGVAYKDIWRTATGKTNGAFSFPSPTRCAYVAADTSSLWLHSTASGISNVPHLYKTVTVPAGQTQVVLSFSYTQLGATNTKLMVYICDDAMVPKSVGPQSNGGTLSTTDWGAGEYLLLFSAATPLTAGTYKFTAPIPPSFLKNCSSPRSFKVVFSSFRGSTSGNNPPPAVDSISLVSRTPVSAAPGIFTINNTVPSSGTNFTNFTDAINWVNAISNCGLNNPITFNVATGQTFNEDVPYLTASGTAAKQIIFQKNSPGINPVIRPTGAYGAYQPTTSNPGTQDYGICLHGADYITFDGIDINSNNVSATIATEYGYLLRNESSTNGAKNNTIKNCTVLLDRTITNTRGILQTSTNTIGGGFGPLNSTGNNNNNSYLNLVIGNVNTGIVLYSSQNYSPDVNNIIGTTSPSIFNQIGRPGVPNDIGGNLGTASIGINVQMQKDITIFNNNITNITTSSSSEGIVVGSNGTGNTFNGIGGINNKIYNNQISFIKSTGTSTSAIVCGMRIIHDNGSTSGVLGDIGFKVYNNAISNLTASYTGSAVVTRVLRGIFLPLAAAPKGDPVVTYEFINNTIVIDGSSAINASSIVFESAFNTGIVYKFRNNLFYNKTSAQSIPAVHGIIGIAGATTTFGAPGSLSDYNAFYNSNTVGGAFNSVLTTIPDFATWKSTYNIDAHSIYANPSLNSNTILTPSFVSPLAGAAPTLGAPYLHDVLGLLRHTPNSNIGAYEGLGDIVSPIMTDTNIMGVNSTANRTLTGILPVVDDGGSIIANTAGTLPRIYFKKSTDANTFGANNSGANGWKWVEATNTSSPFDFTLNYGLLTSAVNAHDVIQYFFVAQDTVSTPNVTANPSTGFAGTSVGSITQAPTSPKSFVIYNTQATYQNAVLSQSLTTKVSAGSTDMQIARLAVQTSAAGDSAYVNSITFNATGINDYANISAAKIWYTGISGAFATTKQFGSTLTFTSGTGALGNITFTGNQIVPPNSTGYFWLTYDIKTTATITDSVDVSVASLIFGGNVQMPAVLDASGVRVIRTAYCVPTLTQGSNCISNVKINTLNNTTSTCALPSVTNFAPIGTATTTLLKGNTYAISFTQASATTAGVVYIDYNDDGQFTPDEKTTISTLNGVAAQVNTAFITIPCNAVSSSEIRMRVRSGNPANSFDACANSLGEIEDYTISIADTAPYAWSNATQGSGLVAAGASDFVMMKLAVVSKGCIAQNLSQLYCNTARTMNANANISDVKLYSTGINQVFSTNNLITALSGAPTANFTLTGFNAPLSNTFGDTSYFWITYNINTGATNTDSIDLAIDSIAVGALYNKPNGNNPSQAFKVAASNTYNNSDVSNPVTYRIPRVGQEKTPVLRIRIITTNNGGPQQLSQLSFVTNNAGVDTTNIAFAKVYYTGKDSTFSTANTPFGNPYKETNATLAQWDPYTINGNQYLNFDTNYFWLTYDIKGTASIGNIIDADLTGFILNGVSRTTTTNNTAGTYTLKGNYCASSPFGSTDAISSAREDISSVTLGSMINTSSCAQTGSFGSIINVYSNYTEVTNSPIVGLNSSLSYSITGLTCGATSTANLFKMYIDWNQNELFTDPGEEITIASAAGTVAGRTVSGTIAVPCTAALGSTRVRIIYAGGANSTAVATVTSCGGGYLFGETEDYTINVVSNPISYFATRTQQTSSLAGKNSPDVNVMRIAIKANGCGTTNLTAMHFKSTGTTSLSDITQAKLYTTGKSNVFNTSNLIGSASVGTSLNFIGLTSTVNNTNATDSNYFWLTYDIASGATAGNTLDAVLDSVAIMGVYYNTIANGNPVGALTVGNRMSFISTAVTQPDISSVGTGTQNRNVMRVLVKGSATSAPILISDLTFNASGPNSLINIDSARLFYTGNTNTFATTTQVGASYSAAPGTWGTFTFNGSVLTSLEDNYFWLAYNIKSGATIGDSVDAEFASLNFDGVIQNISPPNGAPDGSVKIRNQYCTSSGTGNQLLGRYLKISSFTLDGLTTPSTCGGAAPYYTDNTALATRNIQKGASNAFSITNCASFEVPISYTNIYVDNNQDGDFTDDGELVYSASLPFTATATSFVVPCNAFIGLTRLRIISSSVAITSPCGNTAATGETKDYTVNISNTPIAYNTSYASQTNGVVSIGRNGQAIMNIKVKVAGCGVARTTNMYFNTVTTDNPLTNITEAKLYTTGSSAVFSTNKLLGTYTSPNGLFDFGSSMISDTLSPDTINYWLAYDVSPSAINGDTLDVKVDSIEVLGAIRIPLNNNPIEFKTTLAPISISSVTALNPAPDRVAQGTVSFNVLAVRVIGSSTGAPVKATNINFNTIGGGLDVNTITNAKLFYTGSSKTFNTVNQFGSTYLPGSSVSGGKWLPFGFTGDQNLAPDTNYFWLTFDVQASATLGDSIDAELASMTIDNISQPITNPIPTGKSIIRQEYCFSSTGSTTGRCIDTAKVGNIYNISGINGCTTYSNYSQNPALTTDVYAGSATAIYLTFTAATKASVFIDLNKNGAFEPSEEYNLTGNINAEFVNTSILIPANAALGTTRLRLRTFGGQSTGVATNRACNDWNNTESEDYTINVLAPQPQTTYVWNKTSPADFTLASNWTPARAASSNTDNLVFNGSSQTPIVVNNVSSTVVNSIELGQSTKLVLNAPSNAIITATNILTLNDSAQITGNSNLQIKIGESSGIPGSLVLGNATGINATVTRWIGPSNSTNVNFPLNTVLGSRNVNISYGSIPQSYGTLSATFIPVKASGSFGFPLYEPALGTSVNTACNEGYWQLTANDGLSGGLFSGAFTMDSMKYVNSIYQLALIKRTDAFSDWKPEGYANSIIGTVNNMTISRGNMETYGQFTIAADSSQNPLPVSLLRFAAKANNNDALLTWSTASEKNNKGFEIERSVDGRSFEAVTFVKGAGNSALVINYNYNDANAFANNNTLYYRLKQVDLNGKLTYSNIVKVSSYMQKSSSIAAFPNPFTRDYTIALELQNNADVTMVMTDIQGKVVAAETVPAVKGSNNLTLTNIADLQSGVYFLKVTVEGETQILKVIKQ
jgi:hypothetical protein